MNSDPNPGFPPPYPPQGPILAERDIRTWSMLCHLSALVGLLIPSFGAVIGPLVIWLIKRNDHRTIDANGKESLNFQISIMIYTWILCVVGFLTWVILIGFVFFGLALITGLLGIVFAVIASIKVSNGETYRYPLTIRFFQ